DGLGGAMRVEQVAEGLGGQAGGLDGEARIREGRSGGLHEPLDAREESRGEGYAEGGAQGDCADSHRRRSLLVGCGVYTEIIGPHPGSPHPRPLSLTAGGGSRAARRRAASMAVSSGVGWLRMCAGRWLPGL